MTDFRYVGEYKTRDEAEAAFSAALGAVEPQLRLTGRFSERISWYIEFH